ncbi:MAG: response regulator [Bryobacteraceae bacterium]|jgi:DNA-binding NtrC family response regulator
MERTRILVVDDEPEIRALLRSLLSRKGYEIAVACDGVEALSLCQEGSTLDLLLTDVVMPRMDGVQLAEKVSTLYPAARVLYMSGKCEIDAIQRRGCKTGCGFIRKPFEIGRLGQTIQTLLGRAGAPEKRRRRPARGSRPGIAHRPN